MVNERNIFLLITQKLLHTFSMSVFSLQDSEKVYLVFCLLSAMVFSGY